MSSVVHFLENRQVELRLTLSVLQAVYAGVRDNTDAEAMCMSVAADTDAMCLTVAADTDAIYLSVAADTDAIYMSVTTQADATYV